MVGHSGGDHQDFIRVRKVRQVGDEREMAEYTCARRIV
jgi:hypothetical protein